MRHIYRYKADILPSTIVMGIFAIQLTTFFLVENLWVVAGIMLGLLTLSAMPGSIAHNHFHTPTFMRPWMNRIYEVILFLETGVPPYAWTLHHNIGHHKDYLDQSIDPANWQMADGRVMSRIRYDVVGTLKIYPEIFRIGKNYPELLRRFKRWTLISLLVLAVFVLLDPVKALILFVLPMPIMHLGLLDNTYMQHSDMDVSSDFTASRNTTNPVYNFISWNLGYHTAHHIKPHLHWSKLPAYHASIAHQIPPSMICNSVLLSDAPYRHSKTQQGEVRPQRAGVPEISRRQESAYPIQQS